MAVARKDSSAPADDEEPSRLIPGSPLPFSSTAAFSAPPSSPHRAVISAAPAGATSRNQKIAAVCRAAAQKNNLFIHNIFVLKPSTMPEIIFDVYFDVTKKDHTATRPPATVPSFAEDQAALQKTTLPSTDSHPHTSITYNADTDEFTTDTAGLNKTQIISLLATTLQLATQTSLNQTPDLEVTISIHALPSDSETNAHAFIAFLCSTEANYVNHIDLPSTDSAETKSLITHLAIMSAYDVNLRDTIQSLLADTCGSATAASQYFESESKKHSKQPTTDASTTTTPLSKLARSAVATSATSDPIDASDPLSPTTMRRMTTTPPRSSTAREMELSA